MNKNTKKVAGLLAAAVIALIGVWAFNYANNDEPANNDLIQIQEQAKTPEAVVSEDGKTVSYVGVEGQSALSLLKQYTAAETEEFTGLGEYVTGINGLMADSTSNYWSFYVNGEAAQVGAGDYMTKEGDQIEWRLEDVAAFDQ